MKAHVKDQEQEEKFIPVELTLVFETREEMDFFHAYMNSTGKDAYDLAFNCKRDYFDSFSDGDAAKVKLEAWRALDHIYGKRGYKR